MAVAVNIYIKDTQLVPAAISGVVVNVYNATTLAFITSGTTDVAGLAALSLPGAVAPGTAYELRFYKSGVIFTQPLMIAVLEPVAPPNTNDFDITGTVVVLPVATDPRMCRCTGQFINFSGQPIANTLVRVLAILGSGFTTKPPDLLLPPPLVTTPSPPPNIITGFQVPKVVDGKMVAASTMEFKTDINGKVTFDLIRMGQYYMTFAGEEDQVWCVAVPDRSSVNLVELIHPAPVSLTWDAGDAPGNAVAVTVGQTKSIAFNVLFSNFQNASMNLGHIIAFDNSDETKTDIVYDSALGELTITGKAAGTANVTVVIQPNMTPARIPTYSIAFTPLAVTVT